MILSSIQSDARYLATGKRTSTSYEDTDLNANINNWYNIVLGWILSVNGIWQVNEDYATADIVANQREYILPNDILKLNVVYIKSSVTGEYVKATLRDLRDIEDYPEDYTPATPEYDVMDNSLFLYLPDDIVAVTDGIKIYYQTDLTALAGSSDSPNLPSIFTRILSYGAALDHCIANEKWNKASKLEKILGVDQPVVDSGLKKEIKEFYSNRLLTTPTIIIPKEENLY